MKNNTKRIPRFMMFTPAVLCLAAVCAIPAMAGQPQVLRNAVANEPVHFDVSPPLRDVQALAPAEQGAREIDPLRRPKLDKMKAFAQKGMPRVNGLAPMGPSPLISATVGISVEGVGNTSVLNCPSVAGIEVAPPDTNAAVGDTQVVEWVNLCYEVYNKSTGALILGPIAGNQFWAGFGGACQSSNDGDIIIQFDKTNHRWLASQNVFGPYTTCVAVSTTADATGSYYRYAFTQPGFPDYPKWGLTPTVYYQTQNDFGAGGGGYVGVNVCAYDAAKMLVGSTKATQICIVDSSNGTLFDDSMLPADSDTVSGSKHSKAAPEVLLGSIDNFNPGSNLYEYVFTVNFKKPAKSSLAGVNGSIPLAVSSYSLGCGGFGACIPQPGVPDVIDSLGDRLMYRLARFDDGTNQHFMVTHSVNNTSAVAARWYEFRAPSGSTSLSLYQSGQTPDDGEYRWMGSVAYDKAGDIALGYSRSSTASGDYPSIYYSGQTAGDALGTTETEALIKQGGGAQVSTADRWGDYSSMALDGADSCTLWYAQEYYPATGSFAWGTWLASLKFPNCQ